MKIFVLTFKEPIIVKANSIEEAIKKVDDGEIIRAGFKTTRNGVQYEFNEIPDFELKEIK